MKVILKEEVKHVGKEWDLVTVADGYARNFLLPRNLAMPATQAGMKDLERRRQKAAVRREHEEQVARGVAARLDGMIVEVTARSGPEGRLYGSVTASDIAEYIEQHGVEIDRRRVELAEPIRTIGEHHANVALHSSVNVHLRILVHPEGGPKVQLGAGQVEEAPEETPQDAGVSEDEQVEEPAS